MVLGNLGILYLNHGEYEQAIDCFQRDLEVTGDLGDTRSVAETLGNLAIAYKHLGRMDEAQTCRQRSLELKRHLNPEGAAPL